MDSYDDSDDLDTSSEDDFAASRNAADGSPDCPVCKRRAARRTPPFLNGFAIGGLILIAMMIFGGGGW